MMFIIAMAFDIEIAFCSVAERFEEVEELRAKFLFNLEGVTEDSKGLVAGLAIGERGMISEMLGESMNELSLTHLVAVSGANLAIVAAAVFLTAALFGLPRFYRFIIII